MIPSNVSSEEVLGSSDIHIFPNPTSDKLKVVSGTSIGEMVIYNMEGRKLMESPEFKKKSLLSTRGIGRWNLLLIREE